MSATSSDGRAIRRRYAGGPSFDLSLRFRIFRLRLRQLRERALDGRDHAGGHARVTRRRLKFVVSEQSLDNSNVGTAFEQMRREAMAQRMQGQPWLADTGCFDGLLETDG